MAEKTDETIDDKNHAEETEEVMEDKDNSNGETVDDSAAVEEMGESETAEEKSQADSEEKGAENEQDTVDDLKQRIVAAEDKYLRLMAEFDNYKRRTSREYSQLVESANEALMLDIIEVRENFERAINHSKENPDFNGLFEGMKLTFNKLDDILEKNGLEVFTEVGDEFNPEIHDALMKTPHDSVPEDHVAQIFEKGYSLKGKVIKHGRVVVSSGKPEDSENNEEKNDA